MQGHGCAGLTGREVLVEVTVWRLWAAALQLWKLTLQCGVALRAGGWHDLAVRLPIKGLSSVWMREGQRARRRRKCQHLVKQQMCQAWSCMKLVS